MKIEDMPRFTTQLMGIGEIYGKAISESLAEIYWQALEHYALEDVIKALTKHTHNPDGGQYFPKPADIVRLIEGSGETKALIAWTKVETAILQLGAYKSLVFDDALIHAVLEDMGGWVKLCRSSWEDLPFRAQEFQKRYMGYVNRPPKRYPKYCCGLSEAENLRHGYPIQPRLILGDLQKAEEVLLSGGGIPLCIHLDTVFKKEMQRLLSVDLKEGELPNEI